MASTIEVPWSVIRHWSYEKSLEAPAELVIMAVGKKVYADGRIEWLAGMSVLDLDDCGRQGW